MERMMMMTMLKKCMAACLLVLVSACSTTNKYAVEDDLLECFQSQYAAVNIDIAKSIDSAQAVLIEYGVVESFSGAYIQQFLEQTVKDNEAPYTVDEKLVAALENIKYVPSQISCSDSTFIRYDSATVYNSQFAQLLEVYNGIAAQGDFSPTIIATEILKRFDEQDFDHPLYQTYATVFLVSSIKISHQMGTGLQRLLPPGMEEAPDDDTDNYIMLPIEVTAQDEIFVSEKLVTTDDLYELFYDFQTTHGCQAVFEIDADRGASYELFIAIIDNINLAYGNFRNPVAEEMYGKPFSELTKPEQRKVSKDCPKKISNLNPS